MHIIFLVTGTSVLVPKIVPRDLRWMRRRLLATVLLFGLLGCSDDPPPALSPLDAHDLVLAFGDSLTFGTGAANATSYPAILSTLIKRRVVREGVPGEVSAGGLERLPALLDRYRPALLILCHGGNDILQRKDEAATAKNLTAMIRAAQDRGIEVLLVAVPQLGLTGLSAAEVYEDVAGNTRVPLERDALTAILGKPSLRSDIVHPNAAGYRELAQRIADALKRFGALP